MAVHQQCTDTSERVGTPELEALIHQLVRSVRYTSASEVVREALRLLGDRDGLRRVRLEQLRTQVAAGLDEILDASPAANRG